MTPIISMTTIPSRVGKIAPALESLVAQGLQVHVYLPEYCARTGEYMHEAWHVLAKYAGTGVHVRMVPDVGPATKLLYALAEGHDAIITADDDVCYGDGWAQGLIEAAEQNPGSVVCYRGRVVPKGSKRYKESRIIEAPKKLTPCHIVTGVHGALYRSSFFGDSLRRECYETPMNDDIVFSAHLERRGIPRLVIPQRCTIHRTDCQKVDRLGDPNNGHGGNDYVMYRWWPDNCGAVKSIKGMK